MRGSLAGCSEVLRSAAFQRLWELSPCWIINELLFHLVLCSSLFAQLALGREQTPKQSFFHSSISSIVSLFCSQKRTQSPVTLFIWLFAERSDEVSFAGQGRTHNFLCTFIISRSSVETLEWTPCFNGKYWPFQQFIGKKKPCQRDTMLLVAGSNIVSKNTQNPGEQIKQTQD